MGDIHADYRDLHSLNANLVHKSIRLQALKSQALPPAFIPLAMPLDASPVALKGQKVNWILDADITSFFDEIDHDSRTPYCSRRLLGLICKWLQAGVMEDGRRLAATKGDSPRRSDCRALRG